MKDKYLILSSFIILLLQTTVFPFLKIFGVQPNIALIFLISVTIVYGHWQGFRLAMYLGVLFDVLISRGLGVNIFLFLIVSYNISLLEEKIFKDNFVTPIILITLSSFFEIIYFTIYKYLLMGYIMNLDKFIISFVVYAIYNVALGIPIYAYLMRKHIGYSIR